MLLKKGYSVRAFIRPTSYKKHLEALDVELAYGDILNKESLSRALDCVTSVFHAAAVYDLSPNANEENIVKTAVYGTRNLFDVLSMKKDVKKLVYTSSVETVGVSDNKERLLEENNYAEEFPYIYSKAKMQAEKICLELAKRYRIFTVICNPSTVIGKNDYKLTPSNGMLLMYAKFNSFYIDSGQNLVDVEDVAKGHFAAFQSGRNLERYILSGENIEIKHLLLIIRRILNKRSDIFKLNKFILYPVAICSELIFRLLRIEPILTKQKIDKMLDKYNFYDCTKAHRELNYSYRGLETIIPSTLNWLKERHCK